MRFAEDKVTGLLGYALKRSFKILGHSFSQEAKDLRKKRRAYKKANKGNPNKHTGNSLPVPER